MAEVIYTEPEGRDGMEASLDTQGHSGINAYEAINEKVDFSCYNRLKLCVHSLFYRQFHCGS